MTQQRHSRHLQALAAIIFAAILATLGASAPAALPLSELSPERYAQHVTLLASDGMKGRGNGSPELEQAADYIASQFRSYGLRPAGENGSFFQKFEITTGTELGPKNALRLGDAAAAMNRDFITIRFSPAGTFEGPVVFAGYGITAPELDWDDYSGVDVKGKAVLVFRHEPEEREQGSRFNGVESTAHATFVNKAINARRHGASAIIFVTDPNNHASEPDVVGRATQDLDATDLGIIAMHATREAVAPLFQRSGRNLSDIQRKIDADMKPQTFALEGARIRAVADVKRIRKTIRNLLAAVPGSDSRLSREWIVIGAHYDHLGLGDGNSLAPSEIGKVHHGADDNASGTAGVLELARLASRNKTAFKRSILFMTFAGEELGLFGSSHFVNHPTVPLESITAMINMDMIGRVKNDRLDVMGAGTAPDFRAWVEDANKGIGLNLSLSDGGHEGSDHISFNSKHIPILFFFSGLHEDYHRPSDTADKINAKGAIQILSIVATIAERMTNAEVRPQYTEVRQPASSAPPGGGGGGYGPYFGSVPDFRDDLNGVLFADVRSDSPAAKSGLKAGDLLVEFGGLPVRNLQEFTYALGSKKAGDIVPVVVKRGGETIRVNVTLEVRR